MSYSYHNKKPSLRYLLLAKSSLLLRLASVLFAVAIVVSCNKSDPSPSGGGSNNGNNGGGGSGSGSGSGSGGNTNPATTTTPSTFFIADQDHSVNAFGAYYTQQFSISKTTTFSFRFSTLYKAQAAIIQEGQLSAFKNMQAFNGYGIFDNVFGTKTVTLDAGTYYVAIRNTNNGQNKWSMELDADIALPSSDRATRYDYYLSENKAFASGGKTWQPFTVQTGYRYFLDGCNVNTDFFIIPEAELSKFQNGQSFNSYTDYNSNAGEAPGFYEVKLNAGTFYLVSRSNQVSSYTYSMERWKVN